MRRVLLALLTVAAVACQENRERARFEGPYYAVDSLVTALVGDLAAEQPVFSTKTVLNGDLVNKEETYDSAGWAQQLAVFRRLDINRPRLVDQYQVEEKADTLWYTYAPTLDQGPASVVLDFRLIRSPILWEMTGTVKQENTLFGAYQKLTLRLDAEGRLTYYGVTGRQSINLGSTTNYVKEAHRQP